VTQAYQQMVLLRNALLDMPVLAKVGLKKKMGVIKLVDTTRLTLTHHVYRL